MEDVRRAILHDGGRTTRLPQPLVTREGPPLLAPWTPALARWGDMLGFWTYLSVVMGPPVTPVNFGLWSLALPLSLAWLTGGDGRRRLPSSPGQVLPWGRIVSQTPAA